MAGECVGAICNCGLCLCPEEELQTHTEDTWEARGV